MQYSALFCVIVDLEENYQLTGEIIRGGAIKKPDITVELII
jgi:hypothetical protein